MDLLMEGTKKDIVGMPGVVQYERSADHATVIRFKGVDILVKHLSGRITINSGGYHTDEMRDILNRLIKPFKIHGDPWMVKVGYREYEFKDEMSINPSYYVGYKVERTVFKSLEDYETRNDLKPIGQKVFASLEAREQWKDKAATRKVKAESERLFRENRALMKLKRRHIKGKGARSKGIVRLIELLEDDNGVIA